jgi:uncharacterized protein YndB with AHSA1/START domain
MTDWTVKDAYGVLVEPTTLKIERVLPGPIERVWAYLTDSDLRKKWLASGEMHLVSGAPFELVWRNGDLTDPPGQRPDGFAEEHRMESRITEVDPLKKLSFEWGTTGGVTFELEPDGNGVLLTITHRRLPTRDLLLKVAAGWHAHLDVLEAVAAGERPSEFWRNWVRLRDEYDRMLPA